jgi:adenosylhomocysteine nucleosidase
VTYPFAVVTGLAAEAKLIEKAYTRAKRPVPTLACAGANAERAETHAARLIAHGAKIVISFGLCGGLDPELRPGELLLADAIADGSGQSIAVPASLRVRLQAHFREAGLAVVSGALFGSDSPVATVGDKQDLFGKTGARAVDMESHGIAAAAHAAGAQVLAVRAVADPAERNVPKAALTAIGPDGRLRLFRAIATMYVRPWEGPAMIRLAYEARLGFDTLERVAASLAAMETDGPDHLFGGD